MKISVALCTWNGEAFLAEQLASVAGQLHPPDELVVCDDASRDGTADAVRTFAQSAPFPVRLEINPQTLGVVGNFEKALGLCRGDVILLADQDDRWSPDKIGRIAAEFAGQPDLGLVFSDARAIGPAGEALGYRLWQAIDVSRRERRQIEAGRLFSVLLRRNVVTGATLAFRREFLPLMRPIPRFWEHDAWIALLVAAAAPCRAIAEPLIDYRQHASQVQGERVLSWYQQYQIARREGVEKFALIARRYAAAQERLEACRPAGMRPEAIAALRQKVEHFQAKVDMRTHGNRLGGILGELLRGRYQRYSRGWKSLAQDLLL